MGLDGVTSVLGESMPIEASWKPSGRSWPNMRSLRAVESLHYFFDISLKTCFLLFDVVKWHEIDTFTIAILSLLLFIEKFVVGYLTYTDMRVARVLRRLWFTRSYLKWLATHVLIVILVVLLQFYDLLLAIEIWVMSEQGGIHNIKTSLSLYDEKEKRQAELVRLDSHWRTICSTPFTFSLMGLLLIVKPQNLQALLLYAALPSSVCTVVVGSLNFDYLASSRIRAKYASASPWLFIAEHALLRLLEISIRLLTLMVPWIAFLSQNHAYYYIAGVGDWMIGVFALCYSGRGRHEAQGILGALSLMALCAPMWLYDVSRYVDETGVAMSARRLSRYLATLRSTEFGASLLLCLADLFRDKMPLWFVNVSNAGCSYLLLPLIVLQAVYVSMRSCSSAGRVGDDLFTATKRGDVDRVKHIVESRVDVNAKTRDYIERTALHIAAANDRYDVAKYLVRDVGAQIDHLDAEGETALHVSCRVGAISIAELLVDEVEKRRTASATGQKWINVHRNRLGKTPRQMLPRSAMSSRLAALLEEDEKRSSVSDSTPFKHTSSQKLFVQRARAEDVEQLFGPALGGEPGRLLGLGSGPADLQGGVTISSFIFQTGVGDGLGKVIDSVQERAFGHKVKLESLRKAGVIGTGGFGRVIKVVDVKTDTDYALKLQRKDFTTKQAVREAKTLHQHKHAFIVTLHRIFCTDQYFCLLLELCSRDLNVRILEHKTAEGKACGLPDQDVARYAACIALALEFVHGRRIIFRDLKPENILISAPPRRSGGRHELDFAKLADFGLARSIRRAVEELDGSNASPLTTPGIMDAGSSCMPLASPNAEITAMAGTRAFMPAEALDGTTFQATWPAQFKMQWLTGRDWYSYGCCLLLMMLGEEGGRLVFFSGKAILLPPESDDIYPVLRSALRKHRVDVDAFDLTASLTTAEVMERGGAAKVRASPYMTDAIAKMETVCDEIQRKRGPFAAGLSSRMPKTVTVPCSCSAE
eukprot:TRINITY_DN24795_c0_g1_i1.p1 TRINITY_DN24795_c0_g1~~TRINITY_DN24795_c0_g1_i1.p1  ORF type:complete len:986 (+),score=153.32 TRINITY_DN24795_c0_g1_i1:144-3101(+)